MKIAIVCGHFVPTMGYIEVHLANAFHRLGYDVSVITSNATSSTSRHLKSKEHDDNAPYKIIRLDTWIAKGQIVMSKGITKEIEKTTPDKVVVTGPGKVFPRALYKIKNRKFELITLMGDNETNHYKSEKNIRRIVVQSLLKTPIYELAIKSSDKLVGYTPSTKEMVDDFINPKLKELFTQKYSTTSLGFDESEFNFNESDRLRIRKELGIQEEELAVITATRITYAKKIERVIDAMADMTRRGIKFKYVLIGFSEDEYSQQLKKYIASKDLNDVVIPLPFVNRSQMNNYYNMADIGLWTRAAISMFEGLATGLFVLLPAQKNVSHILTGNKGAYFEHKDLLKHLEESVASYDPSLRPTIAKIAKSNFSFDVLAEKLIAN